MTNFLTTTINNKNPITEFEIKTLKVLINTNLFKEIFVAMSTITDKSYLDVFDELGINYKVRETKSSGDARRFAIKDVFEFGGKEGDKVICSDFDHILTWISSNKQEVSKTINSLQDKTITALGRSDKCWDTFPISWRDTEKVVNEMAAKYFGVGKTIDISSGIVALPFESLPFIIEKSTQKWTDIEWLIIGKENGFSLNFLLLDGRDFVKSINDDDKGDDTLEKWFHRYTTCSFLIDSLR